MLLMNYTISIRIRTVSMRRVGAPKPGSTAELSLFREVARAGVSDRNLRNDSSRQLPLFFCKCVSWSHALWRTGHPRVIPETMVPTQ